jgi:hypothetical protein
LQGIPELLEEDVHPTPLPSFPTNTTVTSMPEGQRLADRDDQFFLASHSSVEATSAGMSYQQHSRRDAFRDCITSQSGSRGVPPTSGGSTFQMPSLSGTPLPSGFFGRAPVPNLAASLPAQRGGVPMPQELQNFMTSVINVLGEVANFNLPDQVSAKAANLRLEVRTFLSVHGWWMHPPFCS